VSAAWAAVLLLAGSTFLLRAAGPVLLGGRRLPAITGKLFAAAPVVILAALLLLQLKQGGLPVVAGATGAGLAFWLRAPIPLAAAVAAVVAAGSRWVAS